MSLPGMKYDLHCAVGSKARIGTRIKSAKKLETRVLKKARLVQTIVIWHFGPSDIFGAKI